MTKLFYIFVAASMLTIAQSEDSISYFSIHPSVFYTNGNYSTNVSSNAIELYNSLQLMKEFFLVNHYEYLAIDHAEYKYIQNTFLAGGIVDLFPYYLKFNYSHYKGDYDYKPYALTYSDFSNLFNIDVFFYFDGFYIGSSYTHFNQSGYVNAYSHQLTLRFEKILSDEFFISLKPNLTLLNSDKKLFSVALKLHYAPVPDLLFKAGGFIGEREFYFDSDLLTIFNQNSIQKYQVLAQAEFIANNNFRIITGYQHNKFADFNVNYLFAGIKASFQ